MRIGVDLGGTKIEVAALDEDGAIRSRRRAPTPSGGDPERSYAAILDTIADLVHATETERGGAATVGVATPGALSPSSRLMKNANSTCLIGRRLDADLAARLGRDVRIANDANCFALSEATDGAASGHAVVFGVIVGTGTGGGIVVDGRILTGPNAIAGEWGHNPLPWPRPDELPGPACYCGKRGCIETFLSGPGLARDYARIRTQAPGAAPADAETVVARAASGEVHADRCLARYEDRMARALAHVVNVLDPDAIVLGGGLSNVDRLYRNVPRRWARYVFSDVVTTPLLPPAHGDSSGVRGAARLWP